MRAGSPRRRTAWSVMNGKKRTNGRGCALLRATCLLAPVLLGLTVMQLGGCAGKPKDAAPETQAPIVQEGSLNKPVVISSKPSTDTRAFNESDEQLTEADWKVLESLGPRPIWQQVNKRSKRS